MKLTEKRTPLLNKEQLDALTNCILAQMHNLEEIEERFLLNNFMQAVIKQEFEKLKELNTIISKSREVL